MTWSEDVSQQLDRGKQSSNFENVIGAEDNQPVGLQFNADVEDGALGQLDANNSRIRRTRQLTEKGRRYQADTVLAKRRRIVSRMQRKVKPLMIYFIKLVIKLLLEKNFISILICLSWLPITIKNIANYWVLTKTCFTLSTEYTVG